MTAGDSEARLTKPLLTRTLGACRDGFWAVGLFSLALNLLMLTLPLYMLQIFDRVLTSHSVETLAALSLVAGGAILTLPAPEAVPGLVLVPISRSLDRQLVGPLLGDRVLAACLLPFHALQLPLAPVVASGRCLRDAILRASQMEEADLPQQQAVDELRERDARRP